MKHAFSLLLTTLIIIGKTRAYPLLFKKFPRLQEQIPHITLCDLPTPIVPLINFGQTIGCKNIFMKRDDLTGKVQSSGLRLYGGNKPRKLEFLLADALSKHARAIVTCGSAGSNHAVATTVYAQQVGLPTYLLLKPQPNSDVVQQNLLLDYYYGAHLHALPDKQTRNATLQAMLSADSSLYGIPAGGSNAIGVLGFVNAAFELAQQIQEGAMAEPDLIYIATGSCASVAGLLLGMQAAHLKSHIIAVCVEPEEFPGEFLETIQQLFMHTNAFLHTRDASFVLFDFPQDALTITTKFCGPAYGALIPEAAAAIALFKNTEHIVLEGTYSAKPVAALIDDAATLHNKTVLFWNNYCGIDYLALAATVDYHRLPQGFHQYFEENR